MKKFFPYYPIAIYLAVWGFIGWHLDHARAADPSPAKGASLLKSIVRKSSPAAPAAIMPPAPSIPITARILARHTVQFSTNAAGPFADVVSFDDPATTTNVPAPGQYGFFRDKILFTQGGTVWVTFSTNMPVAP